MWKTHLCDCTSSCTRTDICCVTTACYCQSIPQLFVSYVGCKGLFLVFNAVLWTLFLSMMIVDLMSVRSMLLYGVHGDHKMLVQNWIFSAVGSVLGFFQLGFTTYFLCRARGKFREEKGIEGSKGDDCCVSFWCMPCAIAQMVNYLGTKIECYNACDKDSLGREQGGRRCKVRWLQKRREECKRCPKQCPKQGRRELQVV